MAPFYSSRNIDLSRQKFSEARMHHHRARRTGRSKFLRLSQDLRSVGAILRGKAEAREEPFGGLGEQIDVADSMPPSEREGLARQPLAQTKAALGWGDDERAQKGLVAVGLEL